MRRMRMMLEMRMRKTLRMRIMIIIMLMIGRSGGYDVDLFVERLDGDVMCTICRSVLRCPVRATCSHVFCKSCILEWMKRQETCPCCRRPISTSLLVVMCKLNKAISRLKVKCQNAGCSATFPLSGEFLHRSSCLFQKLPAQAQAQVQVQAQAQAQAQARLCPLGCGALLGLAHWTQHYCYRQLKQQVAVQMQRHRTVAIALHRKMNKLQRAMSFLKRQAALIYSSLEVAGSQEVEGSQRVSETAG
ncbi:RING finger protein 151-like [Centroberyx affinis]|uniref:RING finger protein 151-like n=1 Tax=Centroberyx affinis TaxID=166261 RepID=UPI003A5BD038